MSVMEVEEAIKAFPKEDLAQFNQWYQEFLEDQWDAQIQDDAKAGKLDFLLKEVEQAEKAGTLRPFP
jgi:hypothetical protein